MIAPKHIAFVMDGNGRWAQQRGLPRQAGHKAGYEHIPDVLEICYSLGVKVVSGYAWSTENWDRPTAEVMFIIRALEQHLPRFVRELHQRDIRFVHSGERNQLSARALHVLDESVQRTQQNRAGVFNLCFNYGGRAEIVNATRAALTSGRTPETISEDTLKEHLWTRGLPDVDLVIRTGGDKRLSNFLLWQSAFACLYIVDTYWPAINQSDIEQGIAYYNQVMVK